MKRILSALLCVAMIAAVICTAAVTASADTGYTVSIIEQNGLTSEETSATDAPITIENGSVPSDAAIPATCSYLVSVTAASGTAVKRYTLTVDGTEHNSWISANYNGGNGQVTLFITLPEGTYGEVIARGFDEEGTGMDVLKFTNITVTAAVNSVPDDAKVEYTPCWKLSPSDLAAGSGMNAVTVVENDMGYATFTAGSTGDPYLYYVGGSETRVGRWLLIKYNNHTVIPRMQIYMAQSAGITSDGNMIEFPIQADGSGWTYVLVDMSQNQHYNKDTQAVYHFRFDPLESRQWSNGSYQFTGEETIDVAYIMGFTTRAGAMGYLEANELHQVTKTAVLQESQVTIDGEKATYTDADGIAHEVTKNQDGTYSYTYEAQDVRTPCDTTPKLVIDGSALKNMSSLNNISTEMDSTTGITTVTVTGGDPNATLFSGAKTAARYMAVRYKTTVSDDMEFFLSSTDAGPAAGQSFKHQLNGDGAWHTDIIDLSTVGVSTLNTETYELQFLRMDMFDAASEGSIDLEFVAFFDSEDAAFQYMHEFKTYTATFMANGKVVARVPFEAGATSIEEPAVPEKEGFTGAWKAYTLGDKNITIMAVYTVIDVPTEPTTEPATEPATEPTTDPATEPATVPATEPTTDPATDPATEAQTGDASESSIETKDETTASEDSGCSSAVCGLSILILAGGATVLLRKKKQD